MKTTCPLLSVVSLLLAAAVTGGNEPVSLMNPDQPGGGWEFGNGPEFPGARGKLAVAAETFRGKPVLSLHADFTQGGNYVQAWIALPGKEPGTLSLWVNSPAGSGRLPLRFIDQHHKCHQINLRISEKGGWQYLELPLDGFFKKIGTPDALDTVVAYQSWDAVADSQKHNKPQIPSPSLAILASRALGTEKGTLLLSDIQYRPPAPAAAAIKKTIRLDDILQAGELDWGFNLGQEFPGAKGDLELVENEPGPGQYAMRLHADFTGGGAYVGVRRSFSRLNIEAMHALRFKMRSNTVTAFSVRMNDGTGQCHQRKDLPFTADGEWHEVTLVPTEIAGGEHWAGANDGKWHPPIQLIEWMLNTRSHDGNKPEVLITDIRADVSLAARSKQAAFAEDFASPETWSQWWETVGGAQRADAGRGEKAGSLLLTRSLENRSTSTAATGPVFAVQPGPWLLKGAWKADLHSPDNSYHAAVALEIFDGSGKLLETTPVCIGYGKADWTEESQSVSLPPRAARARFHVQLNKTYGSFWLDDLSAAPLSTEPIEPKIERILLATEAVGNLFLPEEPVAFQVVVEAARPLSTSERLLQYSVRDYWGSEQIASTGIELQKAGRDKGWFIYTASLDLPQQQLQTGRFYQLHVAVPQETGEPVREFSGLAILPLARTRQFQPEQIPFTIRNWDSRVTAYFHLADRLGLRLLGVWGGWKNKPPYKPHCPGVDLVNELRGKWITGTPASSVEREGFAKYSEEALRQGMKNFLEEFAHRGLAMIAMGNEPHGTGEKVLENVQAYRAIYETVKAFDPKVHVVGTSVEPNEAYFKAGYQNYLDSYDFHIYEPYTNVRRTMQAYRALMEKYDAVKPIHSTELGLNSQGQTRHAVSVEMIKKFAVFFAEGGTTVSWFTIQYPDPKGKARGQFGDAHCMFDCKYNLYNPRLDAVTHYHLINGMCNKRFVSEKHYADGVQAYLFANAAGECLQILWRDEGPVERLIALPAGREAELIRIDGTKTTLHPADGGAVLTISAEPVLLLYQDGEKRLGEELEASPISLVATANAVAPGETAQFAISGKGLTKKSLRVNGPPLWKTMMQSAVIGEEGEPQFGFVVEAPFGTPAREGRFYLHWLQGDRIRGEVSVSVPVNR